MKYMGICWECDSCHKIDNHRPWDCPNCKKEVCETCFWIFGLCKECSVGKTDEECRNLAKIVDWEE